MIVVTDTSVVLNLCCLRREELLSDLFGTVFAPPSVIREFQRLAQVDARFTGLVFPQFIQVLAPIRIAPELANNPKLDQGEIEALSLAIELQANAVLIDEQAGRNAATLLDLPHVGILGLFIRSKELELLTEIRPLLDELQSRAGFWISPSLRKRALGMVNE